jgi:2-iminoacetate synthase
MAEFTLDQSDQDEMLRKARELAHTGVASALLRQASEGHGLEPHELAVLWFARQVETESLYRVAETIRQRSDGPLETFSPLYMTNTCDAECRMCGMRRDNESLSRQTVTIGEVDQQLRVLRRRGMHAVALLTGEYRTANRPWALRYVNQALRLTQEQEFSHVLINVGSIDAEEFDVLLEGVVRGDDGALQPKITMCTFQETYARELYGKFMGTDAENPRADFDRRIANFDRCHQAGMRVANPGILVGLNPDLAFEMTALALHARHLRDLGMEVYLSVPRLRQIAGSQNQRGASDDEFVRLVSLLSLGLPDCKLVVTTREPSDMQRKLVPIVTVLSAGSAAVAPYSERDARFDLDSSQFEVIDQRPFEEILHEYLVDRSTILNFEPRPPDS